MQMKKFNTTGACTPVRHYMVDIRNQLAEIKLLVDDGAYFVISRARQYGKTTVLTALAEYLAGQIPTQNPDCKTSPLAAKKISQNCFPVSAVGAGNLPIQYC